MLGISPVKGQAYVFVAKLFRNGENVYRINPDIASGDFKIEFWDYTTDFSGFTEGSGTVSNLATLPKKLSASGSTIAISLTVAEMSHDIVVITAADQDGIGNNWGNNCWVIYPDSRKADLSSMLSSFSAIKGATFNGATDSLEAIRDRGDVAWLQGAGGDASAANQTTIIDALTAIRGATFNGATDSLEAIRDRGDAAWLQGVGDASAANQTTIMNALTAIKGATFNGATDSLEAIRDRGDVAWLTGTGGSGGDATLENQTAILNAIAALNDVSVGDVLGGQVEGNLSLQQVLRVVLAVLAGKATGGGTGTIAFRDLADSKNRVVATVDSNGNRSAITLDAAS